MNVAILQTDRPRKPAILARLIALLFACAALVPQSLRAQAPSPVAREAAAAGAAIDESPADETVEQAPAAPADPLVQQILDLNPRTPEQLVRALLVLLDLGQPAAGLPLVEKLIGIEMDDAARAQLSARIGASALSRLAEEPGWAAQTGPFVNAVLAAQQQMANDPSRLSAALEALNGTPQQRRAALMTLAQGGNNSVKLLCDVLADPARESDHAAARLGLESLGTQTIPALVAMLDSADQAARLRAIEVLARLRDAAVVMELYRPAFCSGFTPQQQQAARAGLTRLLGKTPTAAEASAQLYGRASALYDHRAKLTGAPQEPGAPIETSSADEPVTLMTEWRWDPATSQLNTVETSVATATLGVASRLAAAAYELAPNHLATRRLYLATLLEWASSQQSVDQLLPVQAGSAAAIVMAAGADAVIDLLENALATNHPLTAARAAELLGSLATPEYLASRGAEPCGLVRALRHEDRRVRFAALGALIEMAPKKPYPGSSFLPHTLAWFVSGGGPAEAVVAHPRADEAARMGGLLASVGFAAQIATDGRSCFEKVVASPSCQLVLISNSLEIPTALDALNLLRRDPRTSRLPVAIVATDTESLARARKMANPSQRTWAWIRPMDVEGVQAQLNYWINESQLAPMLPETRHEQAAQALAWLALLATEHAGLYDLSPALQAVELALFTVEGNESASAVLAASATPEAQQTLVDMASIASLPIEARQRAAEAFCQNVKQFGLLLTNEQIVRQYDRYNQSERQGAATQTLLGSILDCIESRLEAEPQTTARPSTEESPAPAVTIP